MQPCMGCKPVLKAVNVTLGWSRACLKWGDTTSSYTLGWSGECDLSPGAVLCSRQQDRVVRGMVLTTMAEPAKLLSRMVRRTVLKVVGALWVGVSPPTVGMICRIPACTCWVTACESVTR